MSQCLSSVALLIFMFFIVVFMSNFSYFCGAILPSIYFMSIIAMIVVPTFRKHDATE